MLSEPAMRASDVDREAAVGLLRNHHAEGRLTLDEFDERMGAAYTAVTLGELARLISDLPPPRHLERAVAAIIEERRRGPMAANRATAASSPKRAAPDAAAANGFAHPDEDAGGVSGRRLLHALWTAVFAVTLVNTVIWLLVLVTDGPVYFWPIWVFGPPAAVLGAAELCVRRHGGERHDEF